MIFYTLGKMGYTSRASKELWYRGKVKADRQGRYFESKTTIALHAAHLGNEQKEEFVFRYSFFATYPHVYEKRPIIHYHYKVKK